MQETKIPSYIQNKPISRENLIQMLKNYSADRQAIRTIFMSLKKDSEMMLHPSPPDMKNEKTQRTIDIGKSAEEMLKRADESRIFYKKTLEEIISATYYLDKLMYCITKLPGYQKNVITEYYIKGKEQQEIAENESKSESTIEKYRFKAIDTLFAEYNKNK